MKQVARPIFRIGLLLCAMAMAVVLLGGAMMSLRDARQQADRLTKGQALLLLGALRGQMRTASPNHPGLLDAIASDLRAQGVQSMAVLNRRGQVLTQFGRPPGRTDFFRLKSAGFVDGLAMEVTPQNSRATILVRMPRPPHDAPPDRRRKWREQKRRGPNGPAFIFLELDPKVARQQISKAKRLLIIDLAAAVLLLLATLVFWRLDRRHDQLQRKLEEDSHLKLLGQVSAALGHEIKNTITSLKGNAQLLKEEMGGNDGHQSASLTTLLAEISYLQETSGQILEFSTEQPLATTTLFIDDLFAAAVEFSDVGAVETEIESGLSAICADRTQLLGALINLLKNARQADDGTIKLNARSQANAIEITVEDRGPGIPEKTLPQIFEPFFTTRAKGFGLGLYQVQRVINRHGGTVVAINLNPGTRFTIILPLTTKAETS